MKGRSCAIDEGQSMSVEHVSYRTALLEMLKTAAHGYSVHDFTEYVTRAGVGGIVKLTDNLLAHPERVAVVFFTERLLQSEIGRTELVWRARNSPKTAPFVLFHADDYFVPHGELTTAQMVESALTILPGRTPTCVVCMEEVSAEDGAQQLPCSHQFHHKCIDHWLMGSKMEELRKR